MLPAFFIAFGITFTYMEKHETKECPRCSRTFTCKTGDIANCQCNTVQVSRETTVFLQTSFYDCLCRDCLAGFDILLKHSRTYKFPTQKEMLMEGLHYYKENGFYVFTELYHLLRGYCCRSNCRHCPYGFRISCSTEDDL